MQLSPELRKLIIEGTPEERIYILKHSFEAFCIYYFTDYFIYDQAEFHHDFFDDCDRMASGKLKETVWVGHKECSKTSFGKMFTIYLIVYGLSHFINYDSYDKGNSESALFDIVVELQTNKKLISDFGSLFNEERADNEKKLKKISSFITANDIKVEAFSTGQSTRGRIYKQYRPDAFVIDDVENSKTINSPLITQQVINHIDELRAGLAADALVLYLGNYQSDQGTVQYIMDTVERSGGVVRFIPAITAEGKPAWSAKYTLTDAEALLWEKENPGKKKKISLENKRKELGEVVFATEMLLNPVSIGDLVFDKPKIERLLATPSEPHTNNAGFWLWDKFNPRHRYAIGADTALGVGRDSNASCLIDFTSLPARQIGSFADATIPPDVFAHELKRQGMMFGTCLLAPEVNNTGYATVTELRGIYDLEKIYRPSGKGVQYEDAKTNQLGFQTNLATKPDIIFQLKSAVEDGILLILDKRILKELLKYRRAELNQRGGKDPNATRHFDLLMATAIAWAMRIHAEANNNPAMERTIEENRAGRIMIKQDTGLA